MTRPDDKLIDMMKGIDISMLVTKTDGGDIAARPMSNNKDVADDGTTYYFSTDDGRIDNDLRADDRCGATYAGKETYVAVQGRGKLHRDRAVHEKHWVPDLDNWFEDGLDTEGLILIELTPERIAWWKGREEGEWTA
ncbi:pyridoxamine 5'-phosphate oxidase family protein [Sphingomicrobium arenosum]|uniref:pyridoxamine 5'-phosphate oxidase family protein n=1 Tax=Sphingomicrobium arenosum TaxID=2233861 RepID=UPI002240EE18|nr:pyridoxamine 5'-phosphate oxidase family protein [Sphingomicrobium arenosum]